MSPNGTLYASQSAIEQCDFYNDSLSDGIYRFSSSASVVFTNDKLDVTEGIELNVGNFNGKSTFQNGFIEKGSNFVNGNCILPSNFISSATTPPVEMTMLNNINNLSNFAFSNAEFLGSGGVFYNLSVMNSDVLIKFTNGSADLVLTVA